MNLIEIVRQSIDSLLRNRLRSGLTMLGIVWGLVTVVLLLSYGKSLGQGVLNGFLGLGDNVIMVWPGQTSMQAGGERSGRRIKFRDGDTEAVRDEVPFLKAVSSETDDGFSFKYGSKVVNIQSKAIDFPYGGMRRPVTLAYPPVRAIKGASARRGPSPVGHEPAGPQSDLPSE